MDVFVNLDENGRMTLPSRIREKYNTRQFILEDRKSVVILKPVMSMNQLFGALPDIDIKKLKQEHIKEVADEDTTSSG